MEYLNKFSQNTKIIGIIGHPIKHSFSPFIHNLGFELTKLDYIYLPFDVPLENLKNAVKGIAALGIKGFNVTLPHKEKILFHLNEVSEEANIIGAVNTVINENGRLLGYNTDVTGVYESLLPYKDEIAGEVVSVFGAGGAARSVIYALIRYFKVGQINIINRTEQTAESLKEYFITKMLYKSIKSYELVPPDLVTVLYDSKLIINTTSLGMHPNIDDSPIVLSDGFRKGQIVFDVVYNPVKTKLLKMAAKKGAKTVNGLTMFIEQGAKSFELWTNTKMPKEKVYKALELYINS
jgi:shikimate dehydrogenase